MKKLGFIFLLAVMSCTTSNQNEEPGTSGIPENGAPYTFDDTPDLERLTYLNLSGILTTTGYSKDGRRAGSWVDYYVNGLPKSVTTYMEGKKEGLHLELDDYGKIVKMMNYHQDLRDGDYKEFENSIVKEERFYKNDKLEGRVRIFYPDGKIMEEGSYKNGTRHGISKWYDQAGFVTIEYEYKNGELIKK
ncbi:MAG: toxin-antitoxin system YwqK family antitoxin [Flammeovirgaceae bacterium]|nr:toxin-antitoxin system YwqK family antitoxin [Flammeovirgaceae bacterium]